MERRINRRQQGDLGEASAIEWLTSIGATVLIPFGHSPHFDLVAEIDGELVRIQVKTSVYRTTTTDGHARWSVALSTHGGNQSWSGTSKRFDPNAVDFVFILVGDGRRWLIPAAAVEAFTSVALGGRKYSEFEIASAQPLIPLVYGEDSAGLEFGSSLGEYPSGQRMRPVKSPAYAFAGSNPASPTVRTPRAPTSEAGSSGDTTKFERALGRSGQALLRAKRQTTIPKRPFNEAGLEVGERMRVRAEGPGRLVFERIADERAAANASVEFAATTHEQADGAAEATPSAEGRVG